MCMYCMIADWGRQWIPGPLPGSPTWPFTPSIPPIPLAPPPTPAPMWPKEMLDQFEDLLRRVKELEDKLGGCPCEEPQKLDYLKEIRKLIEGGQNIADKQI